MRAASLTILTMFTGAMLCVYLVFTSPEYTAQYSQYAAARTAIRQAEEQTRQTQAREWSNTVRGAAPWVGVIVAGIAGAWAAVQWQEQRTRRHVASEDNSTQRHMISAKKDVALAYIAQCGDPAAYPRRLNGMAGVFLPSSNEFVPEDACRAELEQSTALARRQPPTINVAPAPEQRERRFKVVGEREWWPGE